MSSRIGSSFSVSVFGESHGTAIGCSIEGLPAGFAIDFDALSAFMARRAPGSSPLATARRESDEPEFVSGIFEGKTTGAPCTALIRNRDQRSQDYASLANIPRPGHADLTARIKFKGHADMRGGGHFSGRLTAPLCLAGGIALQILATKDIHIASHLLSVGPVQEDRFQGKWEELERMQARDFPSLDLGKGQAMAKVIAAARAKQDSIGARIEAMALGLPAGLGSPMFAGMENRLAQALFGIPAIKGIDFGAGFDAAEMAGSEHNDPFHMEASDIRSSSNHAGGILGGITTGMPLIFRLAVKPTPSIGRRQESIHFETQSPADITIEGRHDPCIALRALPVVEAVFAIVLLDTLIEEATPFDY